MIHPRAAEILRSVNSGPPFDQLGLEGARRHVARRTAPQKSAVALICDLVVGPTKIPVRIYRPVAHGELPVIVFAHSGGWILGSVDGADETCRRLALASNCAVVSVEYRLAPEFPYPAAVEDVLEVLERIASIPSAFELDSARTGLAGESSGAQVVLAAALSRRSARASQLRGQLLVCPALDRKMASRSWADLGDEYIPRRSQMAWMWRLYLGEDETGIGGNLQQADVADLPSTIMVVAQWDPLRDEALAFSQRLKEARVPVEIIDCDGQLHPVFAYAPEIEECGAHLCMAGARIGDLLRGMSE